MKYNVVNIEGKVVNETNLPEQMFKVEINKHVVKQAIVYQRFCMSSNSANTQSRSEVTVSGRKKRQQKRTGMARMGAYNSCHHRGGYVCHGPKSDVKSSMKINKKQKRKALMMALSAKLHHNQFIVLDNINLSKPCTKSIASVVKTLQLEKPLFIDNKNENLYLSSKNCKDVRCLQIEGMNTFSLLRAKHIVITESALEYLKDKYVGDCK